MLNFTRTLPIKEQPKTISREWTGKNLDSKGTFRVILLTERQTMPLFLSVRDIGITELPSFTQTSSLVSARGAKISSTKLPRLRTGEIRACVRQFFGSGGAHVSTSSTSVTVAAARVSSTQKTVKCAVTCPTPSGGSVFRSSRRVPSTQKEKRRIAMRSSDNTHT